MAKVDWHNVFAGIVAGTFFGLPILFAAGIAIKGVIDYNTYACQTVSIPFDTVTTNDPKLESGKQEIDFAGMEGSKQVCTRKNGDLKSETVNTQPQNRVVRNGTYVKPFVPTYFTQPIYDPPTGGGAICMDGSRSYSTGRGTCSWHGGVDYYL